MAFHFLNRVKEKVNNIFDKTAKHCEEAEQQIFTATSKNNEYKDNADISQPQWVSLSENFHHTARDLKDVSNMLQSQNFDAHYSLRVENKGPETNPAVSIVFQPQPEFSEELAALARGQGHNFMEQDGSMRNRGENVDVKPYGSIVQDLNMIREGDQMIREATNILSGYAQNTNPLLGSISQNDQVRYDPKKISEQLANGLSLIEKGAKVQELLQSWEKMQEMEAGKILLGPGLQQIEVQTGSGKPVSIFHTSAEPNHYLVMVRNEGIKTADVVTMSSNDFSTFCRKNGIQNDNTLKLQMSYGNCPANFGGKSQYDFKNDFFNSYQIRPSSDTIVQALNTKELGMENTRFVDRLSESKNADELKANNPQLYSVAMVKLSEIEAQFAQQGIDFADCDIRLVNKHEKGTSLNPAMEIYYQGSNGTCLRFDYDIKDGGNDLTKPFAIAYSEDKTLNTVMDDARSGNDVMHEAIHDLHGLSEHIPENIETLVNSFKEFDAIRSEHNAIAESTRMQEENRNMESQRNEWGRDDNIRE